VFWTSKNQPSVARGDLNKALQLSLEGKDLEARAECDRLIKRYPKFVEAYSLRARVSSSLGEHQQSLDDLAKAIYLNPRDTNNYFLRGVSAAQLGRYKEAIEDFTRVESVDPDPRNIAPALLERARCNEKLGNIELMKEDLERVTAVFKQIDECKLASTALPESALESSDKVKSHAFTKSFFERVPSRDVFFYVTIGTVLFIYIIHGALINSDREAAIKAASRKDYSSAEQHYESAMHKTEFLSFFDPEQFFRSTLDLGNFYLSNGRLDKAAVTLEQAFNVRRGYTRSKYGRRSSDWADMGYIAKSLAWIYEQKHDYPKEAYWKKWWAAHAGYDPNR
jgi:tetratricopeptide (TPR) repeat protein